ncbi:MAG: hypothetical protein IPP87_15405 [Ideonella sp.]|nr:hypothetical protein [Ideonella sp.]MBL0150011.1 hypothetical protein [Ideonella sp.]
MTTFKLRALCAMLASAVLLSTTAPSFAHGTDPSTASSALSLLPVAVVVAAPAALLSGGVVLTVVAVQASAVGTVWVLERASDGARASVELAGSAAMALGTGLVVTALSTGWVLSAASAAVAFIPNEIGASLLYNERVTR